MVFLIVRYNLVNDRRNSIRMRFKRWSLISYTALASISCSSMKSTNKLDALAPSVFGTSIRGTTSIGSASSPSFNFRPLQRSGPIYPLVKTNGFRLNATTFARSIICFGDSSFTIISSLPQLTIRRITASLGCQTVMMIPINIFTPNSPAQIRLAKDVASLHPWARP